MVMRTTVSLADDVAEAVAELRRERAIGISEAVNELVRAGLVAPAPAHAYAPVSHDLGLGIDVSDVAEALERLGGPTAP